jgi:hypothetical protein
MNRLRRWLASDLGRAALLILAIKLIIFVIGEVSYVLSIAESAPLRPLEIVSLWNKWDALHYISIAATGYTALPGQQVMINFMPLFPFLIRLGMGLGLSGLMSAILIANLSSFFGLLVFYRLAALEFNPAEARTALLALAVFPTAYFFNAPYSEGPFLLFAAGAFLAARQNKWAWAGLLGGLASLTRYMGVLLFPALVMDFWLRRKQMKGTQKMIWLLLIPGLFSIYLWINQRTYGNPFAFVHFQHVMFARDLAWPWTGVWNIVRSLRFFAANNQGMTTQVFELAAALFFLVGSIWAARDLRAPYAIFVAGSALISISNTYLIGTPRYLLSAFPLFFLLRRIGRHPNAALALFFLSSTLLVLCAGLYVRGWWAF